MSSQQNSTCETITGKIQHALQRHVPERCYEVTRALQESSHKELHDIFPYLVENIFGFGSNQPGWGLMGISRNQKPQDFMSLLDFLGSQGPLLEVAYRLLADGRGQYEFPVSCLPLTTRHLLDEGTIPTLYTNKVPFCGPGRPISHVMLNPFEYYFFHFAYFIVNPAHVKEAGYSSSLVNFLYPALLEDYLRYFLPTDGNPVPPIPHALHPPYRPTTYSSPMYLAMHPNYLATNQTINPCQNNSFESSFHSAYGSSQIYQGYKRNLSSTPIGCNTIQPHVVSDSNQDEIWRSQSLVLILVEFWLNLSSSDTPGVMLNHVFQEAFLPSYVQMQLVRLLVKHLHSFANSAVSEADTSTMANLSFLQQNSLNEFKRHVIGQRIQKKLYTFLKLSFERWPLDSYFRFVLETWLSYIQPWRYDTFNSTRNTQNERIIDLKWKDFVSENLLFYSGIFQKILLRLFRVDLSIPRNFYVLTRVAKVFSLTNLQQMILDGESRLTEPSVSQFATQIFQSSTCGQLRQNVYDLEGFGFNYEPMFGANVRAQVLSLLSIINRAKLTLHQNETSLVSVKKTWFQTFFNFFSLDNSHKEDMSLADIQKAESYLDIAASQLCVMFKLSMPSMSETGLEDSPVSNGHSRDTKPLKKGLPDSPGSSREIKFQGNPDLQPIRSFEVTLLVRLLYHLSTLINEKYQNDINSLYNRTDWCGRISRQLLAPPMDCLTPSNQKQALPPRVSLRLLAHKQLLAYLLIFYVLGYLLGYGPFSFVIFVTTVLIFQATVKAAFWPR